MGRLWYDLITLLSSSCCCCCCCCCRYCKYKQPRNQTTDIREQFTDDIPYWQSNHFYFDFQKSITFWVWGGKDIKIFGSGVLNGNGQRWYNEFAGREILDPDNVFYRPILFTTDNATRVSVEGIKQLNSPCWTNFFVRSKDVSFDDVFIHAYSTNKSVCTYHSKYTVGGIEQH